MTHVCCIICWEKDIKNQFQYATDSKMYALNPLAANRTNVYDILNP